MGSFVGNLNAILRGPANQTGYITILLPPTEVVLTQTHACNDEVYAPRMQTFAHKMDLDIRSCAQPVSATPAASSVSTPFSRATHGYPEPSSYTTKCPRPREHSSGPYRTAVGIVGQARRRTARDTPVCEECYRLHKRCHPAVPGLLPCKRCLGVGLGGECKGRTRRREPLARQTPREA
ncbi:hypothetical protein OH76DRAFT_311032 [Lentinus brumalis]|uniref:Uncharacterized protein n=1 Tax=Lentinus brumalis TaxID=2498619 RepID=A0A371CK72_9APHY|nr:hypothetical protein OH76DRAFT_311032 [Polyporus brumalis]